MPLGLDSKREPRRIAGAWFSRGGSELDVHHQYSDQKNRPGCKKEILRWLPAERTAWCVAAQHAAVQVLPSSTIDAGPADCPGVVERRAATRLPTQQRQRREGLLPGQAGASRSHGVVAAGDGRVGRA